MEWFKRLTLGKKIIGITFIGVILLTTILGMYNRVAIRNNLSSEFEGRITMYGESIAANLSQQLSVLLSFNDEALIRSMAAPIQNNLENIVRDGDVTYAGILFANGNLMVEATRASKDGMRQKETTVSEKKKIGTYLAKQIAVEGKDHFEIDVPIQKDSTQIGTLRIRFTNERIKHTIHVATIRASIISLIGSLLIAIIIAVIIQIVVIRPLRQVITVAGKVADGDLSQEAIAVKSGDEVGELAAIFNKMISSLRDMFARLGDSNQKELSGNLHEYFKVLSALSVGDLTVKANENVSNQVFRQLGENTNKMISSLKTLSQAAEQVAQGDLRTNIQIRSENDALGNAFARMELNLKNLIGSITGLANMTHRSANKVSYTSDQAFHVMQSIQSSIRQIASATAQVAHNAQEILSLVQNANKIVDTGNNNIRQVIDKFNTVQSAIERTEQAVRKLDEMSKQISEIIGFITKISDQTNLLSLNAAIEAARAGEAGRGFAVVADEVRKLAESSGQSAEKISNIVREIQKDTTGLVSYSQESLQASRLVLELTNNMSSGYNAIVEAIKKISREVEQISSISEETASASEEISASVDEQSAGITQISSSARELVQQVDTLNSEVGKFKI
jgi:methyl-accepting chemotaxis protein